MLILQKSQYDDEIQNTDIFKIINELMTDIYGTLVKRDESNHARICYIYESPMFLKKINEEGIANFSFYIQSRSIVLTIKLQQLKNRLDLLKNFIKQNYDEICQYIKLINLLYIDQEEGLLQIRHQIIGKIKINKFCIFNARKNLLNYLRQKIKQITKIYCEQIQNIILYYRLTGRTLTEIEFKDENRNKVLKKEYQKILCLKENYEDHRKSRLKSSHVNLKENQNKNVTAAIEFIQGLRSLNYLNKEVNYKFSSETYKQVEKQFQKQKQHLQHEKLNRLQGQRKDYIMTTIKIKKKSKQNKLREGGYGEIFCGVYDFTVYATANLSQNQKQKVTQMTVEDKNNYLLVRKTNLQSKQSASIENQLKFLSFCRNRVCPYIGKYYMQPYFAMAMLENKQIYIDHYPNTIQESQMKQFQKLKVIEDVFCGLLFLKQQKIVHHDIKQANVMIDRAKRAKIIDFGSAQSIYGQNIFQSVDDKLRTTPGYYISYNKAKQSFRSIGDKFCRKQFENHPFFDIYSLGVVIYQEFFLDSFTDQCDFMRNNLLYLSQKCTQINPEDRISHEEAIIFIRHLLKFSEIRKKYWIKNYDESNRAYKALAQAKALNQAYSSTYNSQEEMVNQNRNVKKEAIASY